MPILAIESSCDETGAAIYDVARGLLANQLYSQVALHAEFGGVVPELASRDHLRKIQPLVSAALSEANLALTDIEGIAYTAGPGLAGSLLVGSAFAKTLAWSLKIPTLAVNHLEGHLLSYLLEEDRPVGPFIALLVSGGHTLLVRVNQLGDYKVLGETLDDAAGEAFDKTGKLLGLPYPGGAKLSQLAESGKPDVFKFPRPMTNRPGLEFSFSGLKTNAANVIANSPDDQQTKANIAHAFEQAIIETLVVKVKRALKQEKFDQLVVVGGVSANQKLRSELTDVLAKQGAKVFFPRPEFSTDNAAMIAVAGGLRLAKGQRDSEMSPIKPRWSIEELLPI